MEVMDEIDEEITESLEGIIATEKLQKIIKGLQESTTSGVVDAINKHYSENMSAAKKLVLGEVISRVVTAAAKESLQHLASKIIKRSFDVIDELRNEIIGEVFEETE